MSCWALAASLVAEETMREWQSLLQTSHLCVDSDRMDQLPSFQHARLSAAAVISLSSPVLRCNFRALRHFVRSAARPSQDTVSMSTAIITIMVCKIASFATTDE